MPDKCGSSLRSTKASAFSKLAMGFMLTVLAGLVETVRPSAECRMRFLSPLPPQLLLDGVQTALHLLQPLVEHPLPNLLLLPRHNVAVEALLELAFHFLSIGHARRKRGKIGDPA